MRFAARIVDLYAKLDVPPLPKGILAMNPIKRSPARELAEVFLRKFFDDERRRVFIFGINPGRFGGGVTGVMFTDPIALENSCGIKNDLPKKRELSSEFVYSVIEDWGGPTRFYAKFFLTAVCPLGFTKDGLNYNYYDDPALFSCVKPFIKATFQRQIGCGADPAAAIVLGRGKNLKFFEALNREAGFFKKIFALDHPRFVMQYRRPQLKDYIKKYRDALALALK